MGNQIQKRTKCETLPYVNLIYFISSKILVQRIYAILYEKLFIWFIIEMACSERFFSPSVLIHNLSLLLWSEIVLNIEELPDFWNGHALDQGSHLGACEL